MYITDTALKVRRANAYRIFMRRNRVTPTWGGTVRRQALKYAWYKAEARAARVLMARIYRYERERAHGGQP